MGSMMGGNKGAAQQQQGMMYPPQQQYPQQPMMQPQPQFAQQPMMQPQPQFAQQPMMQPQPQFVQQPMMQQQPQYVQQPMMQPQQPGQYRPYMPPQQPAGFRPPFPGGLSMQRPSGSPFSLPHGHDASMNYENDQFLASLTGWSPQDIERLRHEFLNYANTFGVIDREGFRKLYIASLLNMTWEALEHDAEAAFRNFDINQTGFLDFNEYITACSRMTREVNASYSSPPQPPPPPMNQSFPY